MPAVIYKESNNIFQDILLPLNERSFLSENIPVFFCRFIGTNGNDENSINDYYNQIFLLDKKLTELQYGYLKFTDHFPNPLFDEINSIKQRLDSINKIESIRITSLIKKNKYPYKDHLDQKFSELIKLYKLYKQNINISALKNFSMKIIYWTNRYIDQLFCKDPFEVPKIIFYGEINVHELFFLTFISMLGCDILFIHSEIDKDLFKSIKCLDKYTTLIQNSNSMPLKEFPKSEKIVRKSTVAHNASEEIHKIIYDNDSGLYKPWQFASYLTQPITLKTTYDELMILWDKESKLRPEFRIDNNKVYIPNLFAKINGVHREISVYWDTFRKLLKANNVYLINQVPFTKVSYTKRDLCTNVFFINEDGTLDRDKIVKSDIYKYTYLKSSLQDFILTKIEELMASDIYIFPMDKLFKARILNIILSMDENILKLIEQFDFPQNIPKIIIFDNSKEIFSDDDIIIISFLYLVGIDIIIFTPTSYNNIEVRIKDGLFDVHQLPSVAYELQMPDLNEPVRQRKSILSMLFR
ncbi:MAG: YceG family protein [Bacillota bacterium]